MKPKYTINNFTKDNIYYLRGLVTKDIGMNTILTDGFYTIKKFDDNDESSLDISSIYGMSEFYFDEYDSYPYLAMVDAGKIYLSSYYSTGIQTLFGKIHSIPSSGNIRSSYNPDIFITSNNNMLYSISNHLGVGYFKKATAGTSTSITVSGTDFPALGCDTTTGQNKLYNFELKEEFTITGFSGGKSITMFSDAGGGEVQVTTSSVHGLETGDVASITNTTNYNGTYTITKVDATNLKITATWVSDDATGNLGADTITFSAGTGTPSADDEFMVFVDNKFALSTYTWNSTNNEFYGQKEPYNWIRQIKEFQGDYYIGNGNYLAKLEDETDSSTISAQYKQLPKMTQFVGASVNNDKMLIIGKYKENQGRMMLWDGVSPYWNSIVRLNGIPSSVEKYKSGWIMILKSGAIYYTDGKTLEYITNLPSTDLHSGILYPSYNSVKILEDKLFIGVGSDYLGSMKAGGYIHIYDIINKVWTCALPQTKYGYQTRLGIKCLYPLTNSNGNFRLFYGSSNSVGYIADGYSQPFGEAWLVLTLPEKININQIGLNITNNVNDYYVKSYTANVYVSVGDGKNGLYTYGSITSSSTKSKLYPNGSDNKGIAYVDQEIEISPASSAQSNNQGEYAFISSIDNQGQSNEAWNLDEDLSTDFTTDVSVRLYGVKKCGKRTITLGENNKEMLFPVKDFYGDKLYIHIRTTYGLDINGINIY